MVSLPEKFCERISGQLDDELAQEFFRVLDEDSPVSVRINPRKRELLNKPLNLDTDKEVPWNNDAVYLATRPSFIKDPQYHAGLLYPMEAGSMFLRQALSVVDVEVNTILDLCAAPGGKSLLLNDFFTNAVLVSNEIEAKRSLILRENAIKWGSEQHIIINSEASKIAKSGVQFDLVLIDAPCSGEGMFRKDKNARKEWSEEKASGCAIRQRDILKDSIDLVADGGFLIYSTCTYNPDENTDQISYLISEGFECVDIPLRKEWGIETISNGALKAYQFWQHNVASEGFFISVLRKTRWSENKIRTKRIKVPKSEVITSLPMDLTDYLVENQDGKYFAYTHNEYEVAHQLKPFVKLVKAGLFLGEIKGKDLFPSYDLAHHSLAYGYAQKYELSEEEAQKYIRGEAIMVKTEKGILLLTYKGVPISFAKSNAQRINNAYPKHLRVR